jgi:hypothetical protein
MAVVVVVLYGMLFAKPLHPMVKEDRLSEVK